jgi:CheY-specific phosphatase CheX
MIIGNFKNALEDDLGPLALSIPVVIFGRNFTARSVHTAEWVVVPFRCGDEQFNVKVSLSPQPQARIQRRASDRGASNETHVMM